MKIKCEYCGNYIPDTEPNCPNCGAPNSKVVRSAIGVPKTIEQLKSFCASKGMRLDKMRFFIGEDYRGPRAFGIYKDDDGNFIVYKNKADGSRSQRYRGDDEAYAVNEIYQKLKSEVQIRKSAPSRSSPGRSRRRGLPPWINLLIMAAIVILVAAAVIAALKSPNTGYYNYNGSYFYNSNDSWYQYSEAYDTWQPTQADTELAENSGDYWQGQSYSSDYGVGDFSQSDYYESDSSSDWDSDWDDSDWDYDYDSWDSGGSDWDSDW